MTTPDTPPPAPRAGALVLAFPVGWGLWDGMHRRGKVASQEIGWQFTLR